MAQEPIFQQNLISAVYEIGAAATALDGTAAVSDGGSVTYQWYSSTDGTDWTPIDGADEPQYTPGTGVEDAGATYYRVTATNISGTTSASSTSNTATITVLVAQTPVFTTQPVGADYIENGTAQAMTAAATAGEQDTISYQWYVALMNQDFEIVPEANTASYVPPTTTPGIYRYFVRATATLGISSTSADSDIVTVTITAAQTPVFIIQPMSGSYDYGWPVRNLTARAVVQDGGIITYQWYRSSNNSTWTLIPGATGESYRPSNLILGNTYYRVTATNTLGTSSRSADSMVATITIIDNSLTENQKYQLYLSTLRTNFIKLARLDFLNPDGTIAFSIDNNAQNKRSGAFIQDGTLTVNLQNGQRRQAKVTLSNLDGEYDYNVNKIWFGQQIRLMEGLVLPNGEDYYLPQGVFYVTNPQEAFEPGNRVVTYNLDDKWVYLDGTLFGNLDGIYEVPLNSNIFEAIATLLLLDRGNGYPVDNVTPLFTDYYKNRTVTLPDGQVLPVTNTPYTYRCDSVDGTYANVILEMNTMLAGWIGYDATGRLRLDPSQDDILDYGKPVLWNFTPTEREFLGATYSVENTELYNDIIIEGESLDDSPAAKGRATNTNIRSDTNIYGALGRRTKRMQAASYYADSQCNDLANWYLKRYSILKKSVTISSSQMFHIVENNLVTIRRIDKPGQPIEQHLVTGFTRPIAMSGEMTLNCTSVQDFALS